MSAAGMLASSGSVGMQEVVELSKCMIGTGAGINCAIESSDLSPCRDYAPM